MNYFQATCLMYFKTWYYDVFQMIFKMVGFMDM